ncbi:hypothetical protein JOC77_001154 [Peribacillus deserti]|uniref:Uncharacterized protein n=1 Tax=Peribacillus deserti TaxID=673318 RepID=A0ABS2QF19_9BACI|nr:hypothetical protein [Peribacillus deserti]
MVSVEVNYVIDSDGTHPLQLNRIALSYPWFITGGQSI